MLLPSYRGKKLYEQSMNHFSPPQRSHPLHKMCFGCLLIGAQHEVRMVWGGEVGVGMAICVGFWWDGHFPDGGCNRTWCLLICIASSRLVVGYHPKLKGLWAKGVYPPLQPILPVWEAAGSLVHCECNVFLFLCFLGSSWTCTANAITSESILINEVFMGSWDDVCVAYSVVYS